MQRGGSMERTNTPWPDWMLRYVGADTQDALEDLIWSVGGSPPYGGVSYDEASEVYNLLEKFTGPGRAPKAAYEAVMNFVRERTYARDALEVFRCFDQVTSSPESFSSQPVERGLELSRKLKHTGAQATFLSFQAQLAHRNGDLLKARDSAVAGLKMYLELAEQDPVYEKRVAQNATNVISFTAMSGDVGEAKRLLAQLGNLIDEDMAEQLHSSLSQMR